MTDTARYTHWECSSAYEQHYAEDRSHVAKLLAKWGCNGSNQWPNRANLSDFSWIPMTTSWWHVIVNIGQAGIRLVIDHKDLPVELKPEIEKRHPQYVPATMDWYFLERKLGNDHKDRMPTLSAYAPYTHGVMHVVLGCNHQGARPERKITEFYTEYRCPKCDCRWGVDTSG